ncbi:MAG TPA: sensor histidine kinase [Gemmatimonas aurantiaca]|uniref:histidine kinase n=1 Tax=Gemmatimonas aurantiaca TaxID=173480 RepID=A0A3D4VAX2_9BACT|nr:HAMP domain-containing sensor histidine kinase [Gemmatimonas aurantiaca]HCT57778.1 sensor histidine kinase [Gemmatimonas aurantiaca]
MALIVSSGDDGHWPSEVEGPLAATRESAVLLLARIVLWVWTPAFAASILVRWLQGGRFSLPYVLYLLIPMVGWLLLPSPHRSAMARAGSAVILASIGTAIGLLLSGPRATSATGVAVTLTLTVLFFRRKTAISLLLFFIVMVLVGLALNAYGMHATSTAESDLPWLDRGVTMLIMFSGLWFCAGVVDQTVRIYRDAQVALASRQQAMLAAQREAELLQRGELVAAMAAGMAHDIANVVQVMTSSADMLDGHELDDETRRVVSDIRTVGAQASATVRTLLAMGRQQVEDEDGAAPFGLDRMTHLLRALVGRRITLVVEDGARNKPAASRLQLEQAVINLSLNARDAMPSGGTLHLRTADVDAGGVRGIELQVQDNGVGMDEATRGRIFEAHFTTRAHRGGSGLGLSLVDRVVREAGGTLAVQSAPGVGTTFTLWVPTVGA